MTTRPLKDLENRLIQIEKIKIADAHMAALEAKMEKIRNNNPGNRYANALMRMEKVSEKTEENVSDSFDDLMDYMNKQFNDMSAEPEPTDWIPATVKATPYWEKETSIPQGSVDKLYDRPDTYSGIDTSELQEGKKTIRDITDRLMEQLYDTFN